MESKTRIVVIALVILATVLAVIFLIRGIISLVSRKPSEPKTSNSTLTAAKPTPITVNPASVNKDPLIYDGLSVEISSRVSKHLDQNYEILTMDRDGKIVEKGGCCPQLWTIAAHKYFTSPQDDYFV